jgi:hypothetical protein
MDTRFVRPGVLRDLTYPAGYIDPKSLFLDSRDVWIEEIEVDQDGRITLKPGEFDRAAILGASAAFRYAEPTGEGIVPVGGATSIVAVGGPS